MSDREMKRSNVRQIKFLNTEIDLDFSPRSVWISVIVFTVSYIMLTSGVKFIDKLIIEIDFATISNDSLLKFIGICCIPYLIVIVGARFLNHVIDSISIELDLIKMWINIIAAIVLIETYSIRTIIINKLFNF